MWSWKNFELIGIVNEWNLHVQKPTIDHEIRWRARFSIFWSQAEFFNLFGGTVFDDNANDIIKRKHSAQILLNFQFLRRT